MEFQALVFGPSKNLEENHLGKKGLDICNMNPATITNIYVEKACKVNSGEHKNRLNQLCVFRGT